jgi:tetratricopeptide (TPR) repeat protein
MSTSAFDRQIAEAIEATEEEDFLRGLNLFLDAYGSEELPLITTGKTTQGLSYFGLCIAMMRKEYKRAIDLCRRSIDLEFYNADHYANLARVYFVMGNRKKALETVESGLKHDVRNERLRGVRRMLGIRAKPALGFLDRSNPINVSLGQARHAKKVADLEKKTTKRTR